WLVQQRLEGEAVSEVVVSRLVSLLDALPRVRDGRLELFSSLNPLQRYAVFCALQYFETQYGGVLDWIGRLELSMALLYWMHVGASIDPNEVASLCTERIFAGIPDSPWKHLRQWKEKCEQNSSALYFEWSCYDEIDYLDEFALAPEASSEQRVEFTRWLSKASAEQVASLSTLYAWVNHADPSLDCLCTPWGMHLHSPKIRSVLKKMGLSKMIRYIPVHLMSKVSAQEMGKYYLAVYQVRLPCLSRERTIGIWDHDYTKVLDLHRPALLSDRIYSAEIFVVAEYASLVVISKHVKKALEQSDVHGCTFKELLIVSL
ncbi:MAG: hypothetical protein K6U77_07015, partial [Armatimonadetes bacterium]|nr:hypothetical protein [Armatimonadota bacterium]